MDLEGRQREAGSKADIKCPFCGADTTITTVTMAELSARQWRLYQAVTKAGHLGISAYDLTAAMYPKDIKPSPSAYGQMRTAIHGLNAKLRKYKLIIRGQRGKGYRLGNFIAP